jgi:hypothetical protein
MDFESISLTARTQCLWSVLVVCQALLFIASARSSLSFSLSLSLSLPLSSTTTKAQPGRCTSSASRGLQHLLDQGCAHPAVHRLARLRPTKTSFFVDFAGQWCLQGTWCSGITSASHAEGPGFKSQCVHFPSKSRNARGMGSGHKGGSGGQSGRGDVFRDRAAARGPHQVTNQPIDTTSRVEVAGRGPGH